MSPLERVIAIMGALVIGYAGYLALIFAFQERFVFRPPPPNPRTLGSPSDARRVDYPCPNGDSRFAYLLGDLSGSHPVVVAFHGNAELARWSIPWARELMKRTSVAVVLPEYTGYDGLPGPPTYVRAASDARGVIDFLRESGVSVDRFVFFGHSLGTAIATEVAADVCPRVLVLQAPFSSARDMARRLGFRGIHWCWPIMTRVFYDTEARVRVSSCAVWVAHGTQDRLIPVTMGERVYRAAAARGALLLVDGAGHNDVPAVGAESYWSWLTAAVRRP